MNDNLVFNLVTRIFFSWNSFFSCVLKINDINFEQRRDIRFSVRFGQSATESFAKLFIMPREQSGNQMLQHGMAYFKILKDLKDKNEQVEEQMYNSHEIK